MVRIRLRRMGSKKQPQYRIVVANREAARDGKFIEIIGLFNPRTEPETVLIQEDRALHWMNVGAMPSEAVDRLLKKYGTTDRFERLKKGETVAVKVERVGRRVRLRRRLLRRVPRGHGSDGRILSADDR